MRARVRSRPRKRSVSTICGLTVVPETATRIGWASLPKPKPAQTFSANLIASGRSLLSPHIWEIFPLTDAGDWHALK